MNKINQPDIKYLFQPKSIAVIGASPNKDKIGYMVYANIINGGYKGRVYPINPKGEKIFGTTSCKTITEVDGEIDLAVIVIPAKLVFEAVKDCAKKNVKFLSIITSGFSEIGNLEEEKRIVEFAKSNGMRILGPNIFGTYSSSCSLNATFGPGDIMKGGVSIITQSGALGIAMIGKTKAQKIGLSSIISLGNKSDIDEADLLDYLSSHDDTKVIFMYIEGVKNGERLVNSLRKITKKKPVVVIKSGRSKRGALAAASHTGSLAGADEVFSDIMKQCGVNRADTLEQALNWCKYLSESILPKGENTVIITNGGGVGVLAADACETCSVGLYDDQEKLKDIFQGSVPDFGSTKNPIDITGQAGLDGYRVSLAEAIKSDDIHSIICLGCETAALEPYRLSETIEEIYKKGKDKKPFVFSFVGGEGIENSIAYLKDNGVPIFSDVFDSVSCLGALYANYRNLNSASKHFDPKEIESPLFDVEKANKIIEGVKEDNRNFMLANEAKQFMDIVGIRLPRSTIVKNISEAIKAANEISYPVVMKVVSKDIIHKSDAGGVVLNIDNEKEVINAFEAIMHSCRAYKPDAVIKGVEICEMVKSGVETIVGGRIDPSFGPVVMFGLGGIYVEVMKEVAFRALPVDESEALSMIKETKAYPLLLGVRGEDPKDVDSVVLSILKVASILKHCKDISDIEINPLVVYDKGEKCMAVDARILLKK